MSSQHLFVLAIIFMVVVVPILVGGHYGGKKNRQKESKTSSLNSDDQEVIEEMLESIDQMVERIEVLESILDDTHPNWRKVKSRSARD